MLVRLLLLFAFAGCHVAPPPTPPAGTFAWADYTGAAPAFTLRYPEFYRVEARGNTAVFRHAGPTAMRVLFVTEDEARERGLWAKHPPAADITLGGVGGQAYAYDHWDFFSYAHTVTYVVPHAGRFLALEFRTDADTLDAVQREIASSFAFK